MPLSLISSIGGGLNQSINPKPKNINIQTVAGPFSTTITGTSSNYVADVTKNITSGNIYCQGSYIIKCSAWLIEGSISNPSSSLGMICDNNHITYCSSLFNSNNVWFNYDGIQQSSKASDNYYIGFYDVNGSDITYYNSNESIRGNYVDFIFPKSILINTYSFIQRQETLTRTPKNLYIFGSSNGTNWTLISQYTNTNVSSNTWTNISLKSSSSINPYSYIRMSINSINDTSLWNIAEINILYNVA